MAKLEADGEFAEQLFTHGLGVQTAEGMAEWLHGRVRSELGIAPTQGRRYSWGYPSCPEQSELEKVFRLLDAPSIGLRLSGGYAVEPEQSTLAIVAHHPEAVYFGMRSGTLPRNDRQASDELVAGTEKDPTRMATLPDVDPVLAQEQAGAEAGRGRGRAGDGRRLTLDSPGLSTPSARDGVKRSRPDADTVVVSPPLHAPSRRSAQPYPVARACARGLRGTGGADARHSVAPAAVVVVDADERILHVEGEAFARHGLDTGDWTGRALVELLPADAAASLLPPLPRRAGRLAPVVSIPHARRHAHLPGADGARSRSRGGDRFRRGRAAGLHRAAAGHRGAGAQRGPSARGRADGRRRQLGARPWALAS